MQDLPKFVAEELERMHELVRAQSLEGVSHEKLSEWAMSKIDNIHNCYFTGNHEG